MIARILSNTPAWVFVLFLGLLALGLMQTRTRRVGMIAACSLPAGMVALSLAGINSSFGLLPVPMVAWALGLVIATTLGYALFRDRRVAYDTAQGKFMVPGTWVPLMVILAIFFTKYVHAVLRALDVELISTSLFVAVLSGVYGLLSGYFAARAVNLVMRARGA